MNGEKYWYYLSLPNNLRCLTKIWKFRTSVRRFSFIRTNGVLLKDDYHYLKSTKQLTLIIVTFFNFMIVVSFFFCWWENYENYHFFHDNSLLFTSVITFDPVKWNELSHAIQTLTICNLFKGRLIIFNHYRVFNVIFHNFFVLGFCFRKIRLLFLVSILKI